MKKRYLLAITLTIVIMVVFFWKDHPPAETHKEDETEVEQPVQSAKLDTDRKSEEVIRKQLIESQALKDKASLPATTNDQIEEVQKSFSLHLRQLGQCLEVATAVDQDRVDPQFDNIVVSLKPAFGDVIVKMDDWTQWDVQAQDGSMKRIRTEVEYLENNVPTKRAQLYKLNEQGMPVMQPLSEDFATNPTDEYLESLRGGGRTLVDEKASRAYYTEGEELVVIERNGKVQSFSMSKGERTFSCTETDAPTSNCQCL
jgi:hypothetical protein